MDVSSITSYEQSQFLRPHWDFAWFWMHSYGIILTCLATLPPTEPPGPALFLNPLHCWVLPAPYSKSSCSGHGEFRVCAAAVSPFFSAASLATFPTPWMYSIPWNKNQDRGNTKLQANNITSDLILTENASVHQSHHKHTRQETELHCLYRTASFPLLRLSSQKCQHKENWEYTEPWSGWVGSAAMTTAHNARACTTGASPVTASPGDLCLKKTNRFNCVATQMCWGNNPYSSLFCFHSSLLFLCYLKNLHYCDLFSQIHISLTRFRLHSNLLACFRPPPCKKAKYSQICSSVVGWKIRTIKILVYSF